MAFQGTKVGFLICFRKQSRIDSAYENKFTAEDIKNRKPKLQSPYQYPLQCSNVPKKTPRDFLWWFTTCMCLHSQCLLCYLVWVSITQAVEQLLHSKLESANNE